MTALLQPGDQFRIYTRSMSARGIIAKVNRVTISWFDEVQFAPNGPVHHLEGKIPKCEFVRALIIRPDCAFTILCP